MYKKLILPFVFCLLPAFLISCQPAGPDVINETVTVTVVETVTETVEVERKSPYAYPVLREMAETDNYVGSPAAGHSIAFANIDGSLSYPGLVQDSIVKEWLSAGGTRDSIIVLDNMADRDKALENAQNVFDSGAEVFIQFQLDLNTNALIRDMFLESSTYIIAVEVPVPGYPVMGIDNYGAAELAGDWAINNINSFFGGWEKIDRVIYLSAGSSGDNISLRILGSKVRLTEEFGNSADDGADGSKAVMVNDIVMGDDAGAAVVELLQEYPEDEKIIVFCVNDNAASGVYRAAVEQGRWDPDKWLIISHVLDNSGRKLIWDGIIDASVAFFPEKYGKYLVPAALSYIYGNPVPPYIFMENLIMTADNIGEHYP